MSSGSGFKPLDGSAVPTPRGLVDLGLMDPDQELEVTIHLRSNQEDAADKPCTEDGEETFSLEDFHRQFSASNDDVNLVWEYLSQFAFDRVEPHPEQCIIEVSGTAREFNRAFDIELKNYDSLRGKFFGHDGEVRVPEDLLGIIDGVSGLDDLVTLSRVRAEESIVVEISAEVDPDPSQSERSAVSAKSMERAADQREVDDATELEDGGDEKDDVIVERLLLESVQAPAAEDESSGEPADKTPASARDSARNVARGSADNRTRGIPRSARFESPRQKSQSPKTARRSRKESVESLVPPEYKVYDPAEVAKLYQFPEEFDGTGQTIGIISLDGIHDPDDISLYFEKQGIKEPNIEVVTIGSRRSTQHHTHADNFEVTMDLQVAGSVAPGANLVVYRVSRDLPHPYLTALKYVATDATNRPSIISISYGSAEGLFKPRDLQNSNRFFEYITTKGGITICAASGDGGSGSRDHDKMKPGPHVNFPASSPYVLACGGTALESSDGRIVREYAWNDHGQCRLATAGGISQVFERPEYQRKFTLPENKSDSRKFDGRGVPDVAANACLTTGYRVLFRGKYVPNGGTSAAAPMWAGLIARLNQGLNRRLGHIHPHLYELAGTPALRDITEGSNGYYRSGEGWDACTGIGTPVGTELFAALKRKLGVKKGDPGMAGTGKVCLPTTDELATIVSAANSAAYMAQHAAQLAQSAASGFRRPYC